PLGVGRRDMGAVARARVTEQPPEAPLARVAVARQEHESRALAEQQAAAPAVEGPHAVPRERPERVEAAHDEAAEDVVPSRDDQELGRPAVSPSLTLELLDLAAEADAQVAHGEALDARNAVRPGDEPGPERVEVGADRRDGPRRDDGDRLSAHRLASPPAAARTATFTGSPRLRLRLARPRSQARLASGCGSHGHAQASHSQRSRE